VNLVFSRFCFIISQHLGSISTKSAQAAPRLKASMPRAPEPENRSSTCSQSSVMFSRIEKMAPRTISVTGRVLVPVGNFSWWPLAEPVITRISNSACLYIKLSWLLVNTYRITKGVIVCQITVGKNEGNKVGNYKNIT